MLGASASGGRAGHLIQHATQKADRRIADALEAMLGEHERTEPRKDDEDPDDGAAGVLVPAS